MMLIHKIENRLVEEKYVAKYVSMLDDLQVGLTKEIEAMASKATDNDGNWSPSELAKYNRKKKLKKQIRQQVNRYVDKSTKELRNDMAQIYKNEALFTADYLTGIDELGLDADFVKLPTQAVKTVVIDSVEIKGKTMVDYLSKFGMETAFRVEQEVFNSIALGENPRKTAQRLEKAGHTLKGRAEMTTRSWTLAFQNRASLDVYEEGGIQEVRYVATMDMRVCSTCEADHMDKFKLGEEIALPRHPNCRCTYAPIVETAKVDDKKIQNKSKEVENKRRQRFKSQNSIEEDEFDKTRKQYRDMVDTEDYYEEHDVAGELTERMANSKAWKDYAWENHQERLVDRHVARGELFDNYDSPEQYITENEISGWDDFVKNYANKNMEHIEEGYYTIVTDKTYGYIRRWATTSGDSDTEAVAMQLAAREEFDLKDAGDFFDEATKRQAEDLLKREKGVMREVLRTQYNYTQELLKEKGVEDMVLSRGLAFHKDYVPEALDMVDWDDITTATIEAATNPLNSFSTSVHTAKNFATEKSRSIVVTAKVPRDRILSVFRTGFGTDYEDEVVVLGGLDESWAVFGKKTDMSPKRFQDLEELIAKTSKEGG